TGASNWSQLLLAAILVALVGGAFWLKTRPQPASSDPTHLESTEEILARGTREHMAGSYDAAVELYHQVLQRDPGHPQAHYNLGQIYNTRAQYAQAQWEYEAALKADPQFLDARLNLGVVLYRQQQFAAAAAQFRQVLQVAPQHPLALFDLGITLIELGQPDQ